MTGNLLILASVFTTVILFFVAKLSNPEPLKLFSFLAQITGLIGSILISWNFILSTRNRFLERIFDGLDKVYKTHNILGNIAFI